MGRRTTRSATTLADGNIRRAANALRKAGNEAETKRLENKLPAKLKNK